MTTDMLMEQLHQRLAEIQRRITVANEIPEGDREWQHAQSRLLELRSERYFLIRLIARFEQPAVEVSA